MKLIISVFVALVVCAAAQAQTPPQYFTQPGIEVVGAGCTTAFYLDPLCKPCGVGMKSSGNYSASIQSAPAGLSVTGSTTSGSNVLTVTAIVTGSLLIAPGMNVIGPTGALAAGTSIAGYGSNTGGGLGTYVMSANATGTASGTFSFSHVPAYWTMGDLPDAAPLSPSICTTAQWEGAPWGSAGSWNAAGTDAAKNAVMKSFLATEYGYANSGTWHVYYVSQSGTTTSGAPDAPSDPYGLLAPILNAVDTPVSNFSGTASLTAGSNIVTISCPCTSTLGRGSEFLTGAGFGTHPYIVEQLSSTAHGALGTSGTYMMTSGAAATETPEAVTAGYLPGGVIVIEGTSTPWPQCGLSPTSPCLGLTHCGAGGDNPPCFELSGSVGHPLMIMSFPGNVVSMPSLSGTDGLDLQGYGNSGPPPTVAAGYLILEGLEWSDPISDQDGASGGGLSINAYNHLTVEYSEYAGWDKIFIATGNSRDDTVRDNVVHDMATHGVYVGSVSSKCAYLSTPGVDTNFAVDAINYVNGLSCGAVYNPRTMHNVFYADSQSNYDTVHYNSWIDGGNIEGNVIDYSGQPVSLQTSEYNIDVDGNLIFDNTHEAFLIFPYSNDAVNATLTQGSTTMTVSSVLYSIESNNGMIAAEMVSGPNGILPLGTTISTAPGSPGTGTYTLSQPANASGSVVIIGGPTFAGPSTDRWNAFRNNVVWVGQPSDNILSGTPGGFTLLGEKTSISYVKNTSLLNNLIVTTNNYPGTGAGIPFQWQQYNGYPEATNAAGNIVFSVGSETGGSAVMWLQTSTVSTVLPQGYYNFSGGTGCSSSSASFNSCFPSNTFATSNPLPNALESYAQTPGLFDFSCHPGQTGCVDGRLH